MVNDPSYGRGDDSSIEYKEKQKYPIAACLKEIHCRFLFPFLVQLCRFSPHFYAAGITSSSSSSSQSLCVQCRKNLEYTIYPAAAMETRRNSRQKAVVKKQQQEKKRDRISNLPDTILHHIFSFLDMKLAVKTCILSKRWRYLWTTLPYLNFFKLEIEKQETHKLDFVDRVFLLRDTTSSNIQSLNFHIYSPESSPQALKLNVIKGHLNTWIFAAVRASVQHLSIEFSFSINDASFSYPRHTKRSNATNPMFKFPDCLFTCKSLVSLVLRTNCRRQHFETCLPAAYSIISLPLLKTLHLASLTLVDDFITMLISSCPVLESIVIKDCEFNNCIIFSSTKLKYLEIEKCYMISAGAADDHHHLHPVEIKFKLNAPNLISFSIKDCMSKDYTLEKLSSLVKANIDMDVKVEKHGGDGNNTPLELPEEMKLLYAPRMMKFLKALHNVKDLKLSPWFIEVVSGAADLLEIQPTQFCNLRCLELKTWFSQGCIRSIAYLLQICPNIESFSIEVTKKSPKAYMDYDKMVLESEPGLSTECMLYHLKVVTFRGYLGCNELKFLEFLLKNATVLEKLTLTYNGYDYQKKRATEFAEMLHAFPRASSRITIMFF